MTRQSVPGIRVHSPRYAEHKTGKSIKHESIRNIKHDNNNQLHE